MKTNLKYQKVRKKNNSLKKKDKWKIHNISRLLVYAETARTDLLKLLIRCTCKTMANRL